MVVGIHFIEAYLLNPVIYASHLKLHPLIVLSVLVVAEHSLGVWGLLLAGIFLLFPSVKQHSLSLFTCVWNIQAVLVGDNGDVQLEVSIWGKLSNSHAVKININHSFRFRIVSKNAKFDTFWRVTASPALCSNLLSCDRYLFKFDRATRLPSFHLWYAVE